MAKLFKKKFKQEDTHDVGIVSYNIYTSMNNFGAALHSYAFQKYLNKLGIDSVIVAYEKNSFSKSVKKILKENSFLGPLKALSVIYKQYLFLKFFKRECVITKNVYKPNTFEKINTIERFCCETDVTWCTSNGKYDRAFMCDYENMKEKDNIAYSVDFGSKEINEVKAAALKKYAKNFKHISIRNPFRLDEFKQTVEREDIVVTVDPVFLLEREDYSSIIKKPKIKKPFVLVYNCKENNPAMVQLAEEFAKREGLKLVVVNCYDQNLTSYIDSIPTPIGIEEFLGYIENCEYLYTNSYHGICFAVIFAKQFYAFSREANDGKIQTVLSLFDLMHRKIDSLPVIVDKIDYTDIDMKIKEVRKLSEQFLKQAFIPLSVRGN